MAGAVMNIGSSAPTAAPVPQVQSASVGAPHTVVYTVGDAARVTLSSAGGVLTVISSEASAAWSVVSISVAGPTVTVQLTDGIRVVTFTATASGDDVKASVTAAFVTPSTDAEPAPTPELIEQPVPTPVVAPSARGENSEAKAPLPAQPGTHTDEPTTTAERPEPAITPAPATPPPPAVATTAPSGTGAAYGDDGSGSDDHGSVTTEISQPGAEHDDD